MNQYLKKKEQLHLVLLKKGLFTPAAGPFKLQMTRNNIWPICVSAGNPAKGLSGLMSPAPPFSGAICPQTGLHPLGYS